jgi:hypothetical protein
MHRPETLTIVDLQRRTWLDSSKAHNPVSLIAENAAFAHST